MKVKTLGIFDSGLGGYSIYHDLKNQGPEIEYILYADQKNAPYGNKSTEEIYKLAKEAMMWFKEQDISHILLACNTVSAVALDKLNHDFPDMSIWGIIDLTLSQVLDKSKKIAVVSTQATYESHAYRNSWLGSEVIKELALPELVAMIEEQYDLNEIDVYLGNKLKKTKTQEILILACTHFPLVYDNFKKHFSGEILDSRIPIRHLVEAIAESNVAQSKIYTSGNPDILEQQIKNLFNRNEKVRRI